MFIQRLTFSRRITERTVFWGLLVGFGLVVVLLGLAGLVAVRDSRAIQRSAAGLVRDQLLIARLLHEVQAEEDALALALHRLTTLPSAADHAAQIKALTAADKSIERLAQQAAQTPQAEGWQKLLKATKAFSGVAESALNQGGPLPRETLDVLFARHEEVVRLIHDLILLSTEHLTVVDEQMKLQLKDLANQSALLLGSCFILATLSAAATILFVRRGIRRIEWQSDELGRVSWHMLQSQEETARRFSHELHDELGQSLAAVRANLTSRSQDDLLERRADCVHLVDEAIANVRELSQLLRPVILDDFGLDAGLRWLTEKFGQRVRVKTDFVSNLETRLHSQTETHLFRIAQEALTNIARHSEATQVRLSLVLQKQQVILTVEDNGCGLNPQLQESKHSLGLIGMRARARECGGTLALESVQPKGLRVVVTVPARSPDVAEDE